MSDIRTIDVGGGLGYELELAAAPETVWRFWTEADQLVRWMGDVAVLEPRPGGTFRVEYRSGDVVVGEFLEVEAPSRLLLSWGWEEEGALTPPGSTRIEVTLARLSGGSRTRMTMRHTNQPAEALENHDAGWRFFLPRLAKVIAPQ